MIGGGVGLTGSATVGFGGVSESSAQAIRAAASSKKSQLKRGVVLFIQALPLLFDMMCEVFDVVRVECFKSSFN